MTGADLDEPVLRRSDDALVRACPDRTLVLVGASVHTLSGLGVVVWEAFETPSRPSDVMREIEQSYDVDPAASGLDAFIDELVRVGALRAAHESTS